jgi:DNA (cytosine-5)-methyltransferase 1
LALGKAARLWTQIWLLITACGARPTRPFHFPYSRPPSHFERWAEILDQRPDLQPELFGLDHGLANRMGRSDAAGNGVVSLAAAYAWRTLKDAHLEGCEEQP